VGLLEYDYAELAERIQRGLDRLTANFLTAHRARVRRDLVDFHGREHLDFELESGGHHLRVRQIGTPRAIGDPQEPHLEEFESLFDGRPSRETPASEIADWLRALPAGAAPPEPRTPVADADNPFLAEARPKPAAPLPNVFLRDAPETPAPPNPFAQPRDAEARKRRALDWLGGSDDASGGGPGA